MKKVESRRLRAQTNLYLYFSALISLFSFLVSNLWKVSPIFFSAFQFSACQLFQRFNETLIAICFDHFPTEHFRFLQDFVRMSS